MSTRAAGHSKGAQQHAGAGAAEQQCESDGEDDFDGGDEASLEEGADSAVARQTVVAQAEKDARALERSMYRAGSCFQAMSQPDFGRGGSRDLIFGQGCI